MLLSVSLATRSCAFFVAAACAAAYAGASDPKAFDDLKTQYEKLLKLHDDKGTRERRKLLANCFDFLDQKACRKMLRDALENEDAIDTRVVAVQVLGASGDPKDLDGIVKSIAKDKLRGTAIALGEGIGYTAEELAAPAALRAAELAAKAKGDLRVSLLEGVGILGAPAAYDALVAIGDKLTPEEHFVQHIALGACGREKAVPVLLADQRAANAAIRLGTTIGLARSGAPAALPALVDALHDSDPRIVEAAAEALGKAKHTPAAEVLAGVMATAPLRGRIAIRSALVAILDRDVGLDPAAWNDLVAKKQPEPPAVPATEPQVPAFFGIPVASDRVAILMGISASSQWQGRLAREQEGIAAYVDALPDDAEFCVWTYARLTQKFATSMVAGAASRSQAKTWVRKQLYTYGHNLKAAIVEVLAELPGVDTILVASDRGPWGENSAETCQEAIEVIRRANLTRRVRIHTAFVVPGGRYAKAEVDADEFEDHGAMLKLLAEISGGQFVRVEK